MSIGNTNEHPQLVQVLIVFLNVICRILLVFFFIHLFPRPNLIMCCFPLLNPISSLTYGIRLYESLEIGDNKEYDGYRFYRTWMYCFLINIVFEIAAVVCSAMGMSGLIGIYIMILVVNTIHAGRCFLGQWANLEKGNDIHPDFKSTIIKYKL